MATQQPWGDSTSPRWAGPTPSHARAWQPSPIHAAGIPPRGPLGKAGAGSPDGAGECLPERLPPVNVPAACIVHLKRMQHRLDAALIRRRTPWLVSRIRSAQDEADWLLFLGFIVLLSTGSD